MSSDERQLANCGLFRSDYGAVAVRRLLPLALALLLPGCGAGGTGPVDQRLTLLLPAQPGASEAGVYLALARGYDQAEGIELDVRAQRGAIAVLRAAHADAALVSAADLA